jgi:ankyrin repeat protein
MARQQNTREVRALIKQGNDVNAPQPDGATALHWAAHWDDVDTAELLLRAGAKPNAQTNHGVTPLALACENRSVAMVEKLLQGGANPNVAESNGQMPLMVAARTGSADVVNLLLAHGATVDTRTHDLGQTALMWAIAGKHLEVVKVLVATGASVTVRSKRGFTPLMFAAQQGQVEAAQILFAAGALVNDMAEDGTHALPLAIASGHAPFAMMLLERGANANSTVNGLNACGSGAVCIPASDGGTVSRDGITALHAAVDDVGTFVRGSARIPSPQRRELVQALLARGANPNARATAMGGVGYGHDPKNGARDEFALGVGSRRGATPFWLAASSANVDIMRVLLAAGADPTLTPECGSTPLMVAAGLGNFFFVITATPQQQTRMRTTLFEGVRFLVEEVRADVNAVNEAGLTALHGAAYIGDDAIVRYLVAKGAKLNVQDWKGRTPYRIAQAHKAVTEFHRWPGTATLLQNLGADTTLGVDAETAEREAGLAREAQRP